MSGRLDEFVECSRLQGANELFELREHQLDRIQIWRVRWQVDDPGPRRFNDVHGSGALVAGEVVHHQQISRLQDRSQQPVTETGKARCVHGAIEDHGGSDAFRVDRLHERAGFPVTGRNRLDQTFSTKRPTAEPGQIRFETRFVEEDKPMGVDLFLRGDPVATCSGDVLAVLLGRTLRLFLNRARSRRTAIQTVLTEQESPKASRRSWSVASGCCRRCSRRASSVAPLMARLRPRRSVCGLSEPSLRHCRTSLPTTLGLTSKRSARVS